jgi:hypothetical protein
MPPPIRKQAQLLSRASYVERMNSAAKLIMGSGRTLLSEEELGMLVVLRMNREFMAFMKQKAN